MAGSGHRAVAGLLEKRLPDSASLTQGSLTAAVAWSFTQLMIASVVKAEVFPRLQQHTALLEQHPAFMRYPMQ
jgi:glutathione S-transferase